MDRWIKKRFTYKFAAGSFHTQKTLQRTFLTEVEILLAKNSKIAFCATLWET